MITRLLDYTYGGVRSRALAGRLLAPDEWAGLAASESCDEARRQIENRLLLGGDGESIEIRLQNHYLTFARLILATLPAPAGRLVQAYLRRNWVENLVALCRHLLREPPLPGPPVALPTLEQPSLPEADELGSLADLASALPRCRYRELLQSQADKLGPAERVTLENRLLSIYWDTVAQAAERLPGVDRAVAREILGDRAAIDSLRILWRGVRSGLESRAILAALPPLGRLDTPRLKRMLRLENPDHALAELLQLRLPEGVSDPVEGERRWRRWLRRELRRRLIDTPVDIAVPLSVLLLKELETADLAGLLGGLRYGLASEPIAAVLARTEE